MNEPSRPPGEPPGAGPDDPVARLVRLGGPRATAPDDRRARVRRSVHDLWSETVRRERRRRRVVIVARLAAALAIVVGAGLWMWQTELPTGAPAATVERGDGRVRLQDDSIAQTGRVLPAGARVTTAPDGRAALRLIDGASVRLDIATELRLVSPRILELRRGAVYVDSGPQAPETSLEVRTPLGLIHDVGTQFEVRLANDRLRLSVREGAATLERDDRTYSIPGGTSLRVDRSGGVETAAIAPRGEEWDWTLEIAPPFELEGHTLRDYLAWLSRETGWKVEYDDPSIAAGAADVILHGSVARLRPDQTPDVVLPTCGLRHRLDEATLTILRAGAPGAARDPGRRP